MGDTVGGLAVCVSPRPPPLPRPRPRAGRASGEDALGVVADAGDASMTPP